MLLNRLRNVKNSETGQQHQVEQPYRVKPWWYTNQDGKTILEVRYGSRVIELTKGKAGIEVDTVDNLPDAIELVIKAVGASELDEGIKSLVGEFGRRIKTSA